MLGLLFGLVLIMILLMKSISWLLRRGRSPWVEVEKKPPTREELINSLGEKRYQEIFDENGNLRVNPNYKPGDHDDFGWYGG